MEEQQAGPAVPRRRLELIGNGESQIDGRLRQNPAYRLARNMDTDSSLLSVSSIYCGNKRNILTFLLTLLILSDKLSKPH